MDIEQTIRDIDRLIAECDDIKRNLLLLEIESATITQIPEAN